MRTVIIEGQEDKGEQPFRVLRKDDIFKIITNASDMKSDNMFRATCDAYFDEIRKVWTVEAVQA